MKIESVHIENYRCFSDLTVNFDERLTVLVGVNGSGKTAVLDALALFLQNYSQCFISSHLLNTPLFSDLRIGAKSIVFSYKVIKLNQVNAAEKNDGNDSVDISIPFTADNNIVTKDFSSFHSQINSLVNRYKGDGKCCLPILVYYTSKRILDKGGSKSGPLADKQAVYANAFIPQIDFSSSLAWFIDKANEEAREDQRRLDKLISEASQEDLDLHGLKESRYAIPELSAVRLAISKALGEYDKPYVGETPPKLFIRRKKQPEPPFQIEQLSDGYRTMLALVMDLARRMAVANGNFAWPEGQTVLHSPGVVLIDEVELHLHPSWQQTVLPNLMEIFPDTQFIVTTHSPQVLTAVPAGHIRILKDGQVFSLPDNEETEGADAARVLEDVLGVNPRPVPNFFARELRRYAEMVYNEQWDSPEAEELRLRLEEHYRGSEPKLQELALHIENSKWERGL
jgi:predicted ATP-binding protein involved in virulence